CPAFAGRFAKSLCRRNLRVGARKCLQILAYVSAARAGSISTGEEISTDGSSITPSGSIRSRSTLDVRELVADPPDRDQELRLRRILLDAAAQALHERVDAAHGDERVAAPDLGQQRLAAEDDAGVRGEEIEQTKFLIGELDVLPLDAHAAPQRIDV